MKLDKVTTKKRRLRKKLFLGEFQQLGMRIHCQLSCRDLDLVEQLLNDLIDMMHEYKLLICVDAGTDELNALIWPGSSYSSISDTDKQLVLNWLEQRPEVNELNDLGTLDVHHDHF
ncbi:YggL family protein [Shewanella corallii]|uniref:YggL family protein n=1 Tax=Shewanella corallii TaxID=560080 RepID=A0ABT0N802_9GAMM|nr:50S ribosome-binding protein YggL [Shewanella corallii]MCL2914505.1 YggL family protein [Shewanella corallii]